MVKKTTHMRVPESFDNIVSQLSFKYKISKLEVLRKSEPIIINSDALTTFIWGPPTNAKKK